MWDAVTAAFNNDINDNKDNKENKDNNDIFRVDY